MSFYTATGKLMKTIIHDNHFYAIPSCLRISETMTIGDLMFKFIGDSLNDVIGSWKLRIL